MQKLLDTLNLFGTAQLSLLGLVFNFIIVMILAYVLRWHYIRFGHALSNRRLFASIFPVLTTTTFLVISVVKSSLALSLGLVGALSIVRFRTPIKEPEELASLFLAIAIGLGIGADQRMATVVVVSLILTVVGSQRMFLSKRPNHNLYLNIGVENQKLESSVMKQISHILKTHVNILDMRRMDVGKESMQMTYYIDCDSEEILLKIMDELHKLIPQASVTFIDQDREILS